MAMPGPAVPRSPVGRNTGASPMSGVAALKAAVVELREEVTAIRDCLAEANLLRTETFLAQTHRRRFAAIQRLHPIGIRGLTLQMVLHSNELLAKTALHSAGLSAVEPLAGASVGMRAVVSTVAGGLRDLLTHLYICGGADGQQALRSAERYDVDSGTWQPLPPMSFPRAGATAAVHAGRLYICGGISGHQNFNSVERFTPAYGMWEPLPPMKHARSDAVAGVVGGRLCVCGGLDNNQQILDSVEGFSFDLGVWEVLRPLLQPRTEAAAGTVLGCLYVCGGLCPPTREAVDTVEGLDATEGRYLLSPLLKPRYGAAAAVHRKSLYIYGGHDGRQVLCAAERLDPYSGVWEMVAPLATPRAGLAAAAMGDGIYVCGGYDGQQALNNFERLTPAAHPHGLWERLVPSAQVRANPAAAFVLG